MAPALDDAASFGRKPGPAVAAAGTYHSCSCSWLAGSSVTFAHRRAAMSVTALLQFPCGQGVRVAAAERMRHQAGQPQCRQGHSSSERPSNTLAVVGSSAAPMLAWLASPGTGRSSGLGCCPGLLPGPKTEPGPGVAAGPSCSPGSSSRVGGEAPAEGAPVTGGGVCGVIAHDATSVSLRDGKGKPGQAGALALTETDSHATRQRVKAWAQHPPAGDHAHKLVHAPPMAPVVDRASMQPPPSACRAEQQRPSAWPSPS